MLNAPVYGDIRDLVSGNDPEHIRKIVEPQREVATPACDMQQVARIGANLLGEQSGADSRIDTSHFGLPAAKPGVGSQLRIGQQDLDALRTLGRTGPQRDESVPG